MTRLCWSGCKSANIAGGKDLRHLRQLQLPPQPAGLLSLPRAGVLSLPAGLLSLQLPPQPAGLQLAAEVCQVAAEETMLWRLCSGDQPWHRSQRQVAPTPGLLL